MFNKHYIDDDYQLLIYGMFRNDLVSIAAHWNLKTTLRELQQLRPYSKDKPVALTFQTPNGMGVAYVTIETHFTELKGVTFRYGSLIHKGDGYSSSSSITSRVLYRSTNSSPIEQSWPDGVQKVDSNSELAKVIAKKSKEIMLSLFVDPSSKTNSPICPGILVGNRDVLMKAIRTI